MALLCSPSWTGHQSDFTPENADSGTPPSVDRAPTGCLWPTWRECVHGTPDALTAERKYERPAMPPLLPLLMTGAKGRGTRACLPCGHGPVAREERRERVTRNGRLSTPVSIGSYRGQRASRTRVVKLRWITPPVRYFRRCVHRIRAGLDGRPESRPPSRCTPTRRRGCERRLR